ncbi:hypothetical protein HGRIS_004524 [Hohenbuehelia grisea]|uniref:Uncharacterized protein n=1 Tax=Hohenbuehelia grisea TaxID=104357 RepID=A0ABR3JCA4_9AGAR
MESPQRPQSNKSPSRRDALEDFRDSSGGNLHRSPTGPRIVIQCCTRLLQMARSCTRVSRSLGISYVCQEHPEWLAKKLRLSGFAPLHLLWPSNNHDDGLTFNGIQNLLEHTGRIFHLDITSSSNVLDHLARFLPEMRQLRELHLHSLDYYGSRPTLPEILSTLDAPHLYSVELYGIKFLWNSSLIRNLKELRMTSGPPQFLPSILFALTESTQLEVLELDHIFEPQPSAIVSNGEGQPLSHPDLPYLTTLSITHSEPLSVTKFLAHTTCPKLETLKLHFQNLFGQLDSQAFDFGHVIRISADVLKHHINFVCKGEIAITRASFALKIYSSYSQSSHSDKDSSYASHNDRIILDISLLWASSCPVIVRDSAHHFLQRLPLGMIHKFSVTQVRSTPYQPAPRGLEPRVLSTAQWSDILAALPALEELRVNVSVGVLAALQRINIRPHNDSTSVPVGSAVSADPAVPSVLVTGPRTFSSDEVISAGRDRAAVGVTHSTDEGVEADDDLEAGATVYAPQLRRLVIFDWRFGYYSRQRFETTMSYNDSFSLLVECLHRRQQNAPHGIEELVIEKCRNINDGLAEVIMDGVDYLSVQWDDGAEILTADEDHPTLSYSSGWD